MTVHRGEVHSKLVGIMRERLIVGLKQLPTIAARWAALPPGGNPQPSAFSQNMVKQLRILAQVARPPCQGPCSPRSHAADLVRHLCCRLWQDLPCKRGRCP